MGTMVDYAYRFGGSPEALASARAAIQAFQAENADVSGNGSCDFGIKPARRQDGSLSWRCYATGDIDDFETGIAKLTRNSDLRCHAYWGCTDGDSASALNVVERGKWRKSGAWRADIGIEAALAIRQLSAGADAEALLALVDALRVAAHDGWDDDDYPWLLKAGVVGAAISAGMSSHPALLRDARIANALVGIRPGLADAREDLRRLRAGAAAERRGVDQLLATIEGLEIAEAVPAPRVRARRAPAL